MRIRCYVFRSELRNSGMLNLATQQRGSRRGKRGAILPHSQGCVPEGIAEQKMEQIPAHVNKKIGVNRVNGGWA